MGVYDAETVVAGLPTELFNGRDAFSGHELLEESLVEHSRIESEDPISKFLGTFLTERQMEVVGRAKEGSLSGNDGDARLWSRIRKGLLRHPSVIREIARLSGIGSIDELDEPGWKGEAECSGDTRFVKQDRLTKNTRLELMNLCEGCPVYEQCFMHIVDNKMEAGVWAGVSRVSGRGLTGYHDDDMPVVLQEKQRSMGWSSTDSNV